MLRQLRGQSLVNQPNRCPLNPGLKNQIIKLLHHPSNDMSTPSSIQIIRARQTFIYDNVRCFFTGILEAGFKTFMLLIAIRVFQAPSIYKAVLSSIGFAGLFIAPIMVSLASKLRSTPATSICGYYFLFVALSIALSSLTSTFYVYFVLIAVGRIVFKQYIPIMLDVYGNNYPTNERGYRLSYSLMILPIATILFSPIGGYILDSSPTGHRTVLLTIALAAVCGAYAFFKIPSRPIPEQKNTTSMFANFKIILQDKLFFALLIIMALTGIVTQMTIPLRTEYLANERYGLNISNFYISLILVTIPYICRILSSIFWGKIFDRFSLITIRVVVDVLVLVGVIMFFSSTSIPMLILSAIFSGLGYGGGEIIWCLWITKIVEKDKLSQYMSANTAFIGIRSFIAPFIGYFLLDFGASFSMIAGVSAALILGSITGCLIIRDHPRFTKVYE